MTDKRKPISAGRRNQRIALLGLIVNFSLANIKLVAGIVGHSYALIADAVESMADIFGSVVVWGGIRIARQPPDEKHPYGHGKAEAVAALVVGMMLVGAAVGIGVEAVREILQPQRSPSAFTLWVLVGVVAVKETMFQIGRRAEKRTGSSAIGADAWHHRSDAITSLAAGIGITVAVYVPGQHAWADDAAALLASGIILFNAIRIMGPPLMELMDAEQSTVGDKARDIALEVAGVMDIEKVYARKSGTHFWIDMHMEVNPDMRVEDAHLLAHRVKDEIRSRMPSVEDVLIHVEPHGQQRAGETE